MGIILTFILLGVVAAGSFTFLTGTVNVEVEEACTIQTWDGSAWQTRGEGFPLTFTGLYAGESVTLPMRVINKSTAALEIGGTYTMTVHPAGGAGDVTVSGGFSTAISCATGTTQDNLVLTVSNDAPTGDYTFTLDFTRS